MRDRERLFKYMASRRSWFTAKEMIDRFASSKEYVYSALKEAVAAGTLIKIADRSTPGQGAKSFLYRARTTPQKNPGARPG